MTAKVYELLEEYANLLFEYAWAGGEYKPKDAAKAAMIAELDRLVAIADRIEKEESQSSFRCSRCATQMLFDGFVGSLRLYRCLHCGMVVTI